MKAQKTKMKGNEGPKGQNERMKAKKAKNCKMQPVSPLIKFVYLNLIRKRTVFGNLWGGPTWQPRQATKMKGNESPKGQNERNEGPKGQNEGK